MTILKVVVAAAVMALTSAGAVYGETDVLTTAYCMGWLMDQSQNTKLSPDKLRDARERFLALRPVFDQAKDESKGKLTETAMVMEFERAEKARQRLGHVEYFAIVALCDRYADQFRKN